MEKTLNKSENIRKTVEIYKNDSELSLRDITKFYPYTSQSIINYLNNKYRLTPNVYASSQRLTPVEKNILIVYIIQTYRSDFALII
jgi:hypothetical protein